MSKTNWMSGLTTRTRNCLLQSGLTDAQEVKMMAEDLRLLREPNIGKKGVNEVRALFGIKEIPLHGNTDIAIRGAITLLKKHGYEVRKKKVRR